MNDQQIFLNRFLTLLDIPEWLQDYIDSNSTRARTV